MTHTDPVIPTNHDALRAGEVCHALKLVNALDQPVRVQIDESTAFNLPPLVARILMNVLEETAAGRAVTLVPVDTEISTQQAAGLLNISRPFLVTLIGKGLLPARLVGTKRRLPLREVLAYKADNHAKRRAVLDEMAVIDQDLGLI